MSQPYSLPLETMSLYRTLYAELPCSRCQQPFSAQVQFRTGRDDLETYTQGDTIPLEDEGFRAVQPPFDAVADRYCEACAAQRKWVESEAFFQALADLVSEGRLQVETRHWLWRKTLSPQGLLTMGEKHLAPDQKKSKKLTGSVFSHLDGLQLRWDDLALEPGTPPQSHFLNHMNERIAQTLLQKGWEPSSNLLREDLKVYLDTQNRIQLYYNDPT